jgi:hypothetical protein
VSGDTAALGELPVADVAVERLLSTENVNRQIVSLI